MTKKGYQWGIAGPFTDRLYAAVPFDKWFGSYHDGSPEAHAAMMERRKKKAKWIFPPAQTFGTLETRRRR